MLVAPALAIARLLPSVNRALALIVGAAGAAVINALVGAISVAEPLPPGSPSEVSSPWV